MSGPRGRRLSTSERILWREITRHIQPMRPAMEDQEVEVEIPTTPVPLAPSPRLAKPHPPKPGSNATPPLAPLDRRAKQRVVRGHDTIDGRLDLHGLTQAEAHTALLRFLHGAQLRGARLVMVITGKGRGGGEGGVLRRQVPLWLALPEFRSMVVGYDEAHQRHGGAGALYLRVRRVR